MEKTLTIDGKEVRFKSTAATPLRFKAQFGKDFFSEIIKMGALEKLGELKPEEIKPDDLQGLDFEVFYNIAWTMAKTADPKIPDPITWLDGFDEFPMIEVIPALQDMIIATIQGKKK
ncbi:hypothetical protein GCM10007416_32010 [Kroppenstedtia guangzhouensis]|uniref:Prophage pi2 protein 40 n=1 Tax=Kroppenstedtia guangzhouensis TaxID=1274356 RepID=A0ABQ1H2B2_9BACL|nr:hypothetical protein [Kroppenstedtia guangzhouensis]GGA56417.1 hypothetical protein GCM10007416_32010 [Kroppenstedtia guangzhouensis]